VAEENTTDPVGSKHLNREDHAMNDHRPGMLLNMYTSHRVRHGFRLANVVYVCTACLLLALLAGCPSTTPESLPETDSTDVVVAGTGTTIEFDLEQTSHTFKGFGAQIWAYGDYERYPNISGYRKKALSELNIKYVRIENYRETAGWQDMAKTRAMTDELGIKWVYMIWTGPDQYKDSKGLLTDVTGFATWWKDHVVELYEHNIPVEYIELMNEPDSDGQWSTGITGSQYNELVKALRKELDDAGLGGVGIVGAGPASMWRFPGYAKALDEGGVASLAVFSTHAWGTDGAWRGDQGLGPGQCTYKTTVDNFTKPCTGKSPDKPRFVTEYSTHQTEFSGVTYPHGDRYGEWDPEKVFPYYSVIDTMPYAVRTFTNTLALLNAGAESVFVWQANDEVTEVNPPDYDSAGLPEYNTSKRKAWGLIDLWGREKPVYGALKTIYPNIPVGAQVLTAPDQSGRALYSGAFITDDRVVISVSNESLAETTSVINLINAGSLKFSQALAFQTAFRGDPAKGEPDRGEEVKKQLALNPKSSGRCTIDITLAPLSTLTIILDRGESLAKTLDESPFTLENIYEVDLTEQGPGGCLIPVCDASSGQWDKLARG